MREIHLLREFRSEIPGREAGLARARSALDAVIERENREPSRRRSPLLRVLSRPRMHRSRVAILGAGALLLATAAVAFSVLPADRGGTSTAVAALEEVAAVAGQQPPQV